MGFPLQKMFIPFFALGLIACPSFPAPEPLHPDRELISGSAMAEEAGRTAREREADQTTGLIFETSHREEMIEAPTTEEAAPAEVVPPEVDEADEAHAPQEEYEQEGDALDSPEAQDQDQDQEP